MKEDIFYRPSKQILKPIPEPEICLFCYDTGILKIKHHNPDDFLQLMKCSCKQGEKNLSALPRWNQDAAPMFVRVALNPKWFNPNVTENDELDSMGEKMMNKFEQWRSIISKSEQYWAKLGFKV